MHDGILVAFTETGSLIKKSKIVFGVGIMKKSVAVVFTVAFLTSMTGCAYYGSSSAAVDDDYKNSIKIKEDMDKVSAAIGVASINHTPEKNGSSELIKNSLVRDGILIEYPSFGGGSYELKTSDGKDASVASDVSFVGVSKYVGKGVCDEINKQSGVDGIVSVDSDLSQVKKYYSVVSQNHDVKKVSLLPKTVCYKNVKGKRAIGYEVVSLVSRVSLTKDS